MIVHLNTALDGILPVDACFICHQENWNMLVPIPLVLVNHFCQMFAQCLIETLYHSVGLGMERSCPCLPYSQQLTQFAKYLGLKISPLVGVQFAWYTIPTDPVKDNLLFVEGP